MTIDGEPVSADLWEVMQTASAVRRYRDEPVDDQVLERCLQAATWAPSGGNQQPWRFVVLRSEQAREVVTRAAQKTWATMADFYGFTMPPADATDTKSRVLRAMWEHMHVGGNAPECVLFCVQPQAGASELQQGGSIFPPCRISCSPPVRRAWARRSRCGRTSAHPNCARWSAYPTTGTSRPY